VHTIKFRGKSKNTNKWVYGYYIKRQEYSYILENDNRFNERQQYFIEVIAETVGQYTGFNDKKGAEIYEGDILQSEYNSHEKYSCHPIEWNRGSWICNHQINNCCKPWRGDLSGHHSSEIIIGNIYDNPELLKQKINK